MGTGTLGLTVIVVAASGAWAQCGPVWSSPAAGGPTVRAYPGMVYDTSASRVLMYGGGTGSAYRRDLWQWSAGAWSLVDSGVSSGPGARRGHVMAFDADRGTAVVYGGGGVTTSDTWEWSGGWAQAGTTGPTPRGFGAMVYDSAVHACVMFGGWGGGFAYFNDTQLWNGSAWSAAAGVQTPHERGFHAMAYDAARGVVVMYGGLWNEVGGSHTLGDTWEWSGGQWSERTPAHSPGPRAYHSMAYDPVGHRVLLYGGFEISAGTFNDVWAWDGGDWTLLAPAQFPPTLRQAQGLVWDASGGTLLMFGGVNGSTFRNDTWSAAFPPCGPVCDGVDFNQDGLFPDTADIDDFLSVFSGGACGTGACGDIDFNNDGLFPDTLDIDSLLSVFSGGACL
ncbi:MAG: kelch repeat-containing protein [Phycisphaerales bacterium]